MDKRFCDVCKEEIVLSSGKVTMDIAPNYEDQKFIKAHIQHLCTDCAQKIVALIKDWFKKNKK